MTQPYQSNNMMSKENFKNNSINNSLNNINNTNEYNLFQPPIKIYENIQNINNFNYNPALFNLGCNRYFGNLCPFGTIPNNQLLQQQIIMKSLSLDKNFNMNQNFQINENINNNIIYNLNNNNNIILNQNNNINKLYEINNIYNFNNISNTDELNKQNLNDIFNNVKNDKIFFGGNNNRNTNNEFNNKINIQNKNDNLQISKQTICYCPSTSAMNNTSKKIVDCPDGSTLATNNPINKPVNKIKKYKKNSGQIYYLKKFYAEHKHWSKKQIKEISQKIGLKESKVYKWLWDKRNKDIKAKTFIIKKDNKE